MQHRGKSMPKIFWFAFALAMLALTAPADRVLAKERDVRIPHEEEPLAGGDFKCAMMLPIYLAASTTPAERLYYLATEALACNQYQVARIHLRRALSYDPLNGEYGKLLKSVEQTIKHGGSQ